MTQIKWFFSHNKACLWGLDSFGQLLVRNTIPKIIKFFNGWLNMQIWWIVNYRGISIVSFKIYVWQIYQKK